MTGKPSSGTGDRKVEIRICIYWELCNEKTINYISKYMLKDDLNNREFTGKVLTSLYRDWETILRTRRLEIQPVQREEYKRILRVQKRY